MEYLIKLNEDDVKRILTEYIAREMNVSVKTISIVVGEYSVGYGSARYKLKEVAIQLDPSKGVQNEK